MTKKCLEKLEWLRKSGTKTDKFIVGRLLVKKNIGKITILSSEFGVSFSTLSRFSKKLGFPSYKHFQCEFNNDKNSDTDSSYSEENYIQKYSDIAKKISKKIKGKMFILPSKRGQSIGLLLHERLADARIEHELYDENEGSIVEFVKKSVGNTLILISISGYSNKFSHSISALAELDKKPVVIIVTSAKWMNIFKKYDFISLGSIYNKDMNCQNWVDYNLQMLELTTILLNIANEHYINIKGV